MTGAELDMLKQVTVELGYISGGTVCVAKFFEWLKLLAKEKSVGKSKIIELMEMDKKFESEIEALKRSDASQDDTIATLKVEHKEIMSIVLSWFKPK